MTHGSEGIWVTAKGDEIPYEELENDHLINICRCIRKWAANGTIITDAWLENYVGFGEEVEYYYRYEELLEEAERRGIKLLCIML